MLRNLVVAALLAVVVSSGCASQSESSSDAVDRSSPSVEATTSAPPRPAILDEAELPTLEGFGYVTEVSDEESLTTFLDNSVPNEKLVGYLARGIKEGDDLVGRVSLLRFDTPARPEEEAEARKLIMQDFAGKPGSRSTIQGTRVQEVDEARGTDIGAVLWINGTDVVVIASRGLESARLLADAYLTASS